MKLLILGGTQFLGRHLVEAALAKGHEVTIFHRGLTNTNLFSHQVEELLGDRNTDLEILRGRQWDAAIDTCGYFPHAVKASVDLLLEAVKHYTFISSISVYDDKHLPTGADETAAILPLADDSIRTMKPEHYGPLKAACENVVVNIMRDKALIVRPGLLVGPYDPTDRFTYWVRRIARGGEIAAPGTPGRQVQFIDARDVANWILTMAAKKQNGLYNVTGPQEYLSMQQFLEKSKAALNANAEFTWIPESVLTEKGIAPWMEMPLWLPDNENASLAFNLQKAFQAGLSVRSIEETVRDTLDWDNTRAQSPMKAGLTEDREIELLQK